MLLMLVMILEIPIIGISPMRCSRLCESRSGIVVVKVVVISSINNMINVSRDITY